MSEGEERKEEETEEEEPEEEESEESVRNFSVVQGAGAGGQPPPPGGGGREGGERKPERKPEEPTQVLVERINAEFLRRLLSTPQDTRLPILQQWLNTHAWFQQAVLSIGVESFLLAVSVMGPRLLEKERLDSWAADANNMVKDIVEFYRQLVQISTMVDAVRDMENRLNSCEQYSRILEGVIDRIRNRFFELIGIAKYFRNLLGVAMRLMNDDQLMKFALAVGFTSPEELEQVLSMGENEEEQGNQQ